MIEYPYMISNNKIALIITSLQTAAKPTKFTLEFLRNIGYTSTNDRGIVPLFKKLGFLTEDSVPTVYYDQLRDRAMYKKVLANRIRELYRDLFAINVDIYKDAEENVKGAISRVTGGSEDAVKRIYNTFKSLCSIADFSHEPIESIGSEEKKEAIDEENEVKIVNPPEFHYNIQLHLPATTDISVYNAIFKSLRENLII